MKSYTLIISILTLLSCNQSKPVSQINASAIVESMKAKDISEIYKKHQELTDSVVFFASVKEEFINEIPLEIPFLFIFDNKGLALENSICNANYPKPITDFLSKSKTINTEVTFKDFCNQITIYDSLDLNSYDYVVFNVYNQSFYSDTNKVSEFAQLQIQNHQDLIKDCKENNALLIDLYRGYHNRFKISPKDYAIKDYEYSLANLDLNKKQRETVEYYIQAFKRLQ